MQCFCHGWKSVLVKWKSIDCCCLFSLFLLLRFFHCDWSCCRLSPYNIAHYLLSCYWFCLLRKHMRNVCWIRNVVWGWVMSGLSFSLHPQTFFCANMLSLCQCENYVLQLSCTRNSKMNFNFFSICLTFKWMEKLIECRMTDFKHPTRCEFLQLQ